MSREPPRADFLIMRHYKIEVWIVIGTHPGVSLYLPGADHQKPSFVQKMFSLVAIRSDKA